MSFSLSNFSSIKIKLCIRFIQIKFEIGIRYKVKTQLKEKDDLFFDIIEEVEWLMMFELRN